MKKTITRTPLHNTLIFKVKFSGIDCTRAVEEKEEIIIWFNVGPAIHAHSLTINLPISFSSFTQSDIQYENTFIIVSRDGIRWWWLFRSSLHSTELLNLFQSVFDCGTDKSGEWISLSIRVRVCLRKKNVFVWFKLKIIYITTD